ncbi:MULTISPECIES: hypothetical protein [Marilutibacter]|uniref:Uncharacterized protein n=2 Tax=Marilutibacter TaxID=3382698 RepID=A0A508AL52_9GAMM|nr:MULTISPECIES: hypothetical protein [Lysobacter]MBB1061819.1 hypothetical protein [Lysobacter spongiae]TQD49643.1 hypothetical protein FKV25_04415 [Lysobacter aestuarii]
MSSIRAGSPGATRTCPHCKTTILESASVCPACKHHLRFDSDAAASKLARSVPLRVEGTIRPQPTDNALEYSMVVSIRNERGEEIDRQVIGVGALYPGEERSFTLAVEAQEVKGYRAGKGRSRH